MSTVSRSVYQKVCEENKRLKADIKIIVDGESGQVQKYFSTMLKWRKVFKEEKEFNSLMKEAAIQYINDHPEVKM